MSWKYLFGGSLIGLLFSCTQQPADVPLVYYHSFPKDTIVTLQEIPKEPSYFPLVMLMGGGRVLVRSHFRPGEGFAYFVYKYPEMTLLTGFGERSEFRPLWRFDDTRFCQIRGDSLFTYRFVVGDSLMQESALFFDGGLAKYLNVAPLSNDLYACHNSNDHPGMSDYFIRDIRKQTLRPIGQLPISAGGFKSVSELKSAYGRGLEVRPDRMYTLVYYARIRRFRIYDAEGSLLHDVFLDCSSCVKVVDAGRHRWRSYIQDAYVTDKYIYLMANAEEPNGNDVAPCDLFVMTWDGNPVARYRLNQYINSFFIDESTRQFYGINPGSSQCFYSFNLL